MVFTSSARNEVRCAEVLEKGNGSKLLFSSKIQCNICEGTMKQLTGKIRLLKPSRKKLAQVAEKEAGFGFRGEIGMTGPEIERYLSVFRNALNENGSTNKYSDKSVGYPWCCAFVYFCCLKAGFSFLPKQIPSFRFTLAAVPAWQHWASVKGIFHECKENAEIGDIALFNRVYCNKPLDHIGIITKISPDGIISAEGNNDNRTGLFHRDLDCMAGFVRLPE